MKPKPRQTRVLGFAVGGRVMIQANAGLNVIKMYLRSEEGCKAETSMYAIPNAVKKTQKKTE